MAKSKCNAFLCFAGFFLLVSPLFAQLKYDGLAASLSGSLESGYTANYGKHVSSAHSWGFSGAGTLNGYYYKPTFLSYTVAPFVNQSRDNSNYRSTSSASGVGASVNIFSGSHFPGSVSYNRAYDSEGSYSLPGVANYVTHGNNSNLALGWGISYPDAPSLNARFLKTNGDYGIYGSKSTGAFDSRNFGLNSSYRLDGFNIGAFYSTGDHNSVVPGIVRNTQDSRLKNSNDGYGFTVTHRLPLRGQASANVNRNSWDAQYLTYKSNEAVDQVNFSASVNPSHRVSISTSFDYSDNLEGQLFEQILNQTGGSGAANLNKTTSSSDSMDFSSQLDYSAEQHLRTSILYQRRMEDYMGTSYGQNSIGGMATFFHKMGNGSFSGTATMTANRIDQGGNDSLGLSLNENLSQVFHRWNLTESASYAQNQQTLLVTYTTSYFNFNGHAQRQFGNLTLNLGASGGHTGLTRVKDSGNYSQNYFGDIAYKGLFSMGGGYSDAGGQALLTGGGLVPSPLPTPVPPGLVGFYGGHSFAVDFATTPIKGLSISTTYAKALSNTSGGGNTSTNNSSTLNSLVQYRVRKLNFLSGYTRLNQGFSSTGTQGESLSSFHIGVQRWFDFF